MIDFLPRLTAYDPRDSGEGTLDPLGLAQLSTRVAELLVPEFTERIRRPRFLTVLALGAAVLSTPLYDGGAYGDLPDGPAYLGWERLLVEAFAHQGKGDDDALLGIPGIQKARIARDGKARLSSRLHLKNAAGVGIWAAYKSIAVATGVLGENGRLGEAGSRLVRAWVEGTRQADPRDPSGRAWRAECDVALAPLLGIEGGKGKPDGAWAFMHQHMRPDGLTVPEAKVLTELLRDGNDQRQRVFKFVEGWQGGNADHLDKSERDVLSAMTEFEDLNVAWRSRLARAYEDLVGEVTAAFRCVLAASADAAIGLASESTTTGHPVLGKVFADSPLRIETCLREMDAALDVARTRAAEARVSALLSPVEALLDDALGWLRQGATLARAPLFDALIERHLLAQGRKPPDGKRPWIEGTPGHWSVRLKFMDSAAPTLGERVVVHGYRTFPVRSCLRDLRRARP
jgi:hypothetical protein